MDPRTPPNCARCRNHYITIALIGHKRYCKYRACKCQKCCLTSERQHAMAKQTALRRAQTQDRHMIRTEVQIDGFQIERQPSNEAVPVAPVVHLLADVVVPAEVEIDNFQIERQSSNKAVPVAPVVHLADELDPAEIIHEDILAGAAGKDECVICLEGPKLIVAVPCGHRCFCTRCGPTAQEQFQLCPFCRADINSFLRIY